MNSSFVPSIATIKKWVEYWRKFKGKRVKVYLRNAIKMNYKSPNPWNIAGDTSFEMSLAENLIGTVSDIIESPFGIMLKDISSEKPELKDVENVFVPMSEITQMHIFKKKAP